MDIKQASWKVNRESLWKEILPFLSIFFHPRRLQSGVERGGGGWSRRQRLEDRKKEFALYSRPFFTSIPPSLSSDLYSSRHRGLVYKIFALVMRPWLSNWGAVTAPPLERTRTTANRRVWVPVTSSNILSRISTTEIYPDSLAKKLLHGSFHKQDVYAFNTDLYRMNHYNTSPFSTRNSIYLIQCKLNHLPDRKNHPILLR